MLLKYRKGINIEIQIDVVIEILIHQMFLVILKDRSSIFYNHILNLFFPFWKHFFLHIIAYVNNLFLNLQACRYFFTKVDTHTIRKEIIRPSGLP